ncbi:MAG: hypothetical protein OXI81_01350 [Paracoccaceae bacterium]|nr:hypothetical protein [Paracoccaceae bacterium]
MLVDRPDLVRVRLELARTLFLKGKDRLAKQHFEPVLASDPPAAVRANAQRFLDQIRARKRWTVNLGFALAPDTKIGAVSGGRTVNILIFGTELPFVLDNRRTSGRASASPSGRAGNTSTPRAHAPAFASAPTSSAGCTKAATLTR